MATSANILPPNPAAAREDWTPPYRRRLGVGDSIVQLCPFGFWKPPNPGEFKINFSISLPETDPKTGNYVSDIGGFGAVARNSSGDPFGTVKGNVKFDSKMGLGLYALRAAANLSKALKEKGIHDGPVVYESNQILVTISLDRNCLGDPEANLKAFMPDDLESVDARCVIRVGTPDRVLHWNPGMRATVEEDKRNAGVPIFSSANISFDDGGTSEEHWSVQYRRRLGIGNSPVAIYNNDPPKHGEFKIIFNAHEDDVKEFDLTPSWTICAMALNSSMKPFGITGGSMKFTSEMGMQLHALRAAGNLVKKLKDKGIHDGPVVYQSAHLDVTAFLSGCQGEPDAVMPDLESVDTICLNIVGTNPKKLFSWVDRLSTPALKALIKRMKESAGVR